MMKVFIALAQSQADKVLRSPRTLQFLSDPRVQKKLMQLINLRGELRQRVSGTVQGFAKTYSIATRDDMAKVRRTMREMERTIAALQKELTILQEQEAEKAASDAPKKRTTKKPRGASSSKKKG